MNKADIIGEITSLAVHISETQQPDIFVEYSGHVDTVKIRIYSKGWEPSGIDNECNPDIELRIWLDDNKTKVVDLLDDIKQQLREIGGYLED